MKKILFLSVFCVITSLQAKDIETDSAVLRTMDKITGRVQKIMVERGKQTQVGTLTVLMERCLKRPPEETPENAAFLTIMDEDMPEKPAFRGWMFSSNPALSAMEHPVYDIWVVECGKTNKTETVSDVYPTSEEQSTDEPIED